MRLLIVLTLTYFTLAFAPPAHATLQYFGYYNVNGLSPWVDYQDHIPEIGARGNANIGVITVSVISKLPQYLTEMRQHKMYAILGVTAMFESPTQEANWQSIKNTIKGYEDVVYGFYFDESAWRGIGVNEFRSYTSQIRADYPTKATMFIEGYPPIAWGTMPQGYLDYITDFGFDFYGTVENPNSFEEGWANYLTYYQKIYQLSAGKKVWLVPDGYGYYNSPPSTLAAILQRYYQHALAHPEVVGMLVFRYDPGDNNTYYTVQDAMNPGSKFYDPGVVHTHNSVGKAILANAPPYPSPSAKPGDLNSDGSVNIFDFNLPVSRFGNPYTIFDFNQIVGNYGK